MRRKKRRIYHRRSILRKTQKWKAAFFLACIGFLLISIGVVTTIPKLLAREQSTPTTLHDWNGKRRITIVVPGEPIRVVSLHPETSSLVVIDIPADMMVTVPHGYGQYRIGAVEDLGALDEEIGGARLLMHTVQELFAIPVDGYIDIRSIQPELDNDIVAIFRQLIKDPRHWLDTLHIHSTLAQDDLLRFVWFVAWVRFDRVRHFSLEVTGDIDQVISSATEDDDRRERRPRVAVLNGTTHPGLAASLARYVEQAGGAVVSIDNAEEQGIQKTRAIGNPTSPVLQRLQRVFTQTCPETCTIQSDGGTVFDVDIAVIVGEDYWEFLHGQRKKME